MTHEPSLKTHAAAQPSDMVFRVATALIECGIYPSANQVGHSRDAYLKWARAALEASYHAELVEAVRWTVEQIELCAQQAGAPPRQSMIYLRLTGLLAKIGGDA